MNPLPQKLIIFIILLLSAVSSEIKAAVGLKSFETVKIDAAANNVYALCQSSDRLIWVGTNQGLLNFDGYTAHKCYVPGGHGNIAVYCITEVDGLLYLGTDDGVLIYDARTDRYVEHGITFPNDVRTLLNYGNELWIGSLNGLFTYDIKTHKIRNLTRHIPNKAVYSLSKDKYDNIFIGTYNGLSRYDCGKQSFDSVVIPKNSDKWNVFVNAVTYDSKRNCLWIGTEGELYRYDYDNRISRVAQFSGNSIKSMALDRSGTLVLGTDDGLYFHDEKSTECYRHDSRVSYSLSNNMVWSVMVDADNNVWAGTEYDISVSIENSDFEVIHISELTGRGDGTHIHNMLRDSKGYLWIGGTNGIIKYDDSESRSEWYMMGDAAHSLPHNRIRDIYEDRQGDLWIATDGGINRYDYEAHKFIRYAVSDRTGTFNTNWAYGIFEDFENRMWIGAYLGGVHVISRGAMLSSNGFCVSDKVYNTSNGLPDNNVNQILQTVDGGKWVLPYKDKYVVKIDDKSGRICKVDIFDKTKSNPNYIFADKESGLWCGFTGGIAKIDGSGEVSHIVKFATDGNITLLAAEQIGDFLWLSTTNGVWALDTRSFKISRLPLPDKSYVSLYYDNKKKAVLLGGMDEIVSVSPSLVEKDRKRRNIIITGISVNDKPLDTGKSVRTLDKIVLRHSQTHVVVEFSDLGYELNNQSSFEYRIKGLSDDWISLPDGVNRISISNLSAGTYSLQIRSLNHSDFVKTLPIVMMPAWYYSNLAIALYSVLAICLILWAVNFFRLRIKLRMERIERDKTLELVRHRIDFLTNISHELKTPLSLIIGPVSKLITDEKRAVVKKSLTMIHDNAMKLDSLIHRALEIGRMENNQDNLLIYSDIEMVGFCRSIFEAYQEAYPNKHFVFNSDEESIATEVDAVKLESVINNIVTNACKYSSDDATIALSIRLSDNIISISISDDGIGIPSEELPMVFQRLFQSSATTGIKDGVGIGLYLAKTYIEMHGGSVSVESEYGQGSVFTVKLPIIRSGQDNESEDAEFAVAAGESRKKILIVDDNKAIAEFLKDILKEQYECIVANSGKAGIAVCSSVVPNLMIVDVMMPGMSGLEMCRRLKKNSKLSEIPIILLTAKDDKATEAESIEIGIDTFMSKPFEAPILLARVNQLLAAKEIIRSNVRIEEITGVNEIKAETVDEKMLAEVNKVIEDNIADNELNVGFVCEKADIQQKQLYRLIKKYIGISPVDYIRQIRMKKAAMLLQQNKFTVSEVMYMVGFSSSSYFSKCFSAQFGCTPRQYSENYSKE